MKTFGALVLGIGIALAAIVFTAGLAGAGSGEGKGLIVSSNVAPAPPADIVPPVPVPEKNPCPPKVVYRNYTTLLGVEVPFANFRVGFWSARPHPFPTCCKLFPKCHCRRPDPCDYYDRPGFGVGYGGYLGGGMSYHDYYGGHWGHGYRVMPRPDSHYVHQWRPHHYGPGISVQPRPDSHYLHR